jgi:hypothetical protein
MSHPSNKSVFPVFQGVPCSIDAGLSGTPAKRAGVPRCSTEYQQNGTPGTPGENVGVPLNPAIYTCGTPGTRGTPKY